MAKIKEISPSDYFINESPPGIKNTGDFDFSNIGDLEKELEGIQEEDPDLSEVEKRIEEANCYKVLLNNSLFENGASSIALKVEKRS